MPNISGEFRPVRSAQKGLHEEVVLDIDDNFLLEFLKKRDGVRQRFGIFRCFIRDEGFD